MIVGGPSHAGSQRHTWAEGIGRAVWHAGATPGDGPVLVQTEAIGVCGTDLEIINGDYGWAPPGQERLIIGRESLGRVIEAEPETGFSPGDLVVGIVRRPDPVPCPACGAGDWDMCTNGQYTERGIKARHGFASERYRIHPGFLVPVDAGLGGGNRPKGSQGRVKASSALGRVRSMSDGQVWHQEDRHNQPHASTYSWASRSARSCALSASRSRTNAMPARFRPAASRSPIRRSRSRSSAL